jgi:hypothetical protein
MAPLRDAGGCPVLGDCSYKYFFHEVKELANILFTRCVRNQRRFWPESEVAHLGSVEGRIDEGFMHFRPGKWARYGQSRTQALPHMLTIVLLRSCTPVAGSDLEQDRQTFD